MKSRVNRSTFTVVFRRTALPFFFYMLNALYFDGDIQSNFLGHIMAEIFKEQVYFPLLEGRQDLTILDIGAHVGIFSVYAARFAKRIYAVEPDLDHFEALVKNTESLPVTPINAALSSKNGETVLYKNPNRTMYSLLPAVADQNIKPQPVKTITLSTLLKENSIDKVDFMKLDVEGEEPNILCGEDFIEAAKKIDCLVMEVHAWNGRHPNQLREALKNNGFTKMGVIPNDAQLWWARK